MDHTTKLAVGSVVNSLLANSAYSATKYLSEKLIVRATRKLFKSEGRQIRKSSTVEIVLTIGQPNYLERDFIKDCRKAKEPFPVKNVVLKFPPKPKKRKK